MENDHFTNRPERLLAWAVSRMPAGRREWGAAMLAELAQLQHPAARWQFALGCARVALFPPRQNRLFQLIGGNTMKSISASPGTASLLGALCLVPFLFLNWIVVTRFEPFFSWLRPGAHTSPQEYVLLPLVLLLFPVGAFIAARPMFRQRRFFVVNSLLTVFLLLSFAALSYGLGKDFYRCEILRIAGCD